MQQDIHLRIAVVCPRRYRQLNTYSKTSIPRHKIARVNSPLGRLKPYFRRDIIITIHKSLFLLHFDYCSKVRGYLGKTQIVKLQKFQNKAARVIACMTYNTRFDCDKVERN